MWLWPRLVSDGSAPGRPVGQPPHEQPPPRQAGGPHGPDSPHAGPPGAPLPLWPEKLCTTTVPPSSQSTPLGGFVTRPPLTRAVKCNGSGRRAPAGSRRSPRLAPRPRPLTGRGDTALLGREGVGGGRSRERAQGQGPDRQHAAGTASPQTAMTKMRQRWSVGREVSTQHPGIFHGCVLCTAGHCG